MDFKGAVSRLFNRDSGGEVRARVLFVCMGNICRSPTAEGVLRHKIAQRGLSGLVEVASAGTIAYHVGDAPDSRAQAHAARRGYDISRQRGRVVHEGDYVAFDHLLAMDHDNLAQLEANCPPEHHSKLALLMRFSRKYPEQRIIPDPYYGGPNGFEIVLDYIEDACDGLIDTSLAHLRPQP